MGEALLYLKIITEQRKNGKTVQMLKKNFTLSVSWNDENVENGMMKTARKHLHVCILLVKRQPKIQQNKQRLLLTEGKLARERAWSRYKIATLQAFRTLSKLK